MPCYALSENSYSVDSTKEFIPFDRDVDSVSDRPGSLIVDICPFLIQLENENILCDPGLGLKLPNGSYHIVQNLLHQGV